MLFDLHGYRATFAMSAALLAFAGGLAVVAGRSADMPPRAPAVDACATAPRRLLQAPCNRPSGVARPLAASR